MEGDFFTLYFLKKIPMKKRIQSLDDFINENKLNEGNQYGSFNSAEEIAKEFVQYAWDYVPDYKEKYVIDALKDFIDEEEIICKKLSDDERWTISEIIDKEGLASDDKVYKLLKRLK